MIEVFRTNVRSRSHAKMLVGKIHSEFEGYEANFDLDDTDNILRIDYPAGAIESPRLITFLQSFGFDADVLPDECHILHR